jgi:hypothetical protein
MADIGSLGAGRAQLDQVLTRMPTAKCPSLWQSILIFIRPSEGLFGPLNFGQFVPINRMFNRRC